MKRFAVLFLLPLLTGCSSESLADRVYTRAIGLSQQESLVFTMQASGEDGCETVQAQGIAEAIRLEEAKSGGKVFVGHTELLCLDGTLTLEGVQKLFYEECLSPGCKVLLTAPEVFLENADSTAAVHSLRMAEKNGLLPSTDISTVLSEWLGEWNTALLPSPANNGQTLVFLHENGSMRTLSEEAGAGMYWLRRNEGGFAAALGEEEIRISGIRINRTAEKNAVHFDIQIRTRDCPERFLKPFAEKVQSECESAVSEMLAAHADVIGLQEALEAAGFAVDAENMPEVTVSVSVQ